MNRALLPAARRDPRLTAASDPVGALASRTTRLTGSSAGSAARVQGALDPGLLGPGGKFIVRRVPDLHQVRPRARATVTSSARRSRVSSVAGQSIDCAPRLPRSGRRQRAHHRLAEGIGHDDAGDLGASRDTVSAATRARRRADPARQNATKSCRPSSCCAAAPSPRHRAGAARRVPVAGAAVGATARVGDHVPVTRHRAAIAHRTRADDPHDRTADRAAAHRPAAAPSRPAAQVDRQCATWPIAWTRRSVRRPPSAARRQSQHRAQGGSSTPCHRPLPRLHGPAGELGSVIGGCRVDALPASSATVTSAQQRHPELA